LQGIGDFSVTLTNERLDGGGELKRSGVKVTTRLKPWSTE
jgi:hypothetical protein